MVSVNGTISTEGGPRRLEDVLTVTGPTYMLTALKYTVKTVLFPVVYHRPHGHFSLDWRNAFEPLFMMAFTSYIMKLNHIGLAVFFVVFLCCKNCNILRLFRVNTNATMLWVCDARLIKG